MAEPQFKTPRFPPFALIEWALNMITGRSARCPHCDEPVRPKATVCRSCGRSISDAPAG